MKRIFPVILIFLLSSFVFAQNAEVQQKPLTQAEYVKMLYDLQKNPGKADELIETIRTRGIGFELTDGIRGLTRTKGANNEELKRTLEEAERRRQNPTASKLPSEKDSLEVLEKTRKNTLDATEEMPDFTVKQIVGRSIAYAGTNNWKPTDTLIIGVNYSLNKGENYKVLSVNGTPVNAEGGNNYAGLGGATSGGEFVEDLAKIFRAESKTEFKLIDTDVIRSYRTLIYEYEIALENNKGGVGYKDYIWDTVATGEKGKIWIDRDNFRVLRIESQDTNIPTNFAVKAVSKIIDYDWTKISEQKYLLPISSTVRFTALTDGILLQTRNIIRFKNYQKYGSEVKILDGDEEEVKEEPKPNQ